MLAMPTGVNVGAVATATVTAGSETDPPSAPASSWHSRLPGKRQVLRCKNCDCVAPGRGSVHSRGGQSAGAPHSAQSGGTTIEFSPK